MIAAYLLNEASPAPKFTAEIQRMLIRKCTF
jgi:hypothetical protein